MRRGNTNDLGKLVNVGIPYRCIPIRRERPFDTLHDPRLQHYGVLVQTRLLLAVKLPVMQRFEPLSHRGSGMRVAETERNSAAGSPQRCCNASQIDWASMRSIPIRSSDTRTAR